ncbi:carboxylesterase/lipase family protein [Alkalihalobacillus sp. 1P02AB]|uniref:carboxylesterase/lipase family protein n=1 Tax=Alkalihalobacillus sp. 1P02AB TaxID=3132260 RepID=UPI0039A6CA53
MFKWNNIVRFMLGITIWMIITACSTETENESKESNAELESVKLNPSKPINVSGGQITGVLSSNSEVAIYKGIPYAAPPIGDLRWKEPQSVIPWEGVKEASQFGQSCIQPEQAPFMMWSEEFIINTSKGYSEDCLTLNVWTNTDSTLKEHPVIVYIHGGGNTTGGSSVEVYDGEAIAEMDAVYVSINYRLGILGFLAHPELSAESIDGVSGNYALLDQIAALEWIKNNISEFGGDPNNITIIGQSAGSMNVNMLTLSPKAKGLFKNAVAMSFNVLNSEFDTLTEKEAEASKLFEGKTLKEMKSMPVNELLALNYSGSYNIDGKVVTDNPVNVLKEGNQNDVTMMSGNVKGDIGIDGILPLSNIFELPTTISKEDYEDLVEHVFGSKASEALALYPAPDDDAINPFNEMNQDAMMAAQLTFAKLRGLQGKAPTYVYYFDHVMPGNESGVYGAFHTADVPYFLNYFSPLREEFWTQMDYDLGELVSEYLVILARTGNPNEEELESWKAYNGDMSFIHFGEQVTTTSLSDEKGEFWRDYYNRLFGL